MIQVWRTTKRKYVDTAYSGEGARRAGARFNKKGTPLVYTSWSLSLSVLEILTQVVDYEDLLEYVAIPASFEDHHVKSFDVADLPEDWRALPAPESTKVLGTAWAASKASLVLRVPSVIVPSEHNYLIDPEHPHFEQLRVGNPQALDIDPRLLKG